MTKQVLEELTYQGLNWYFREYPLKGLADPQILSRFRFKVTSSDCWRGYVGSWAIREDRLYLVGINAKMSDGTQAQFLDLFPNAHDGVFAHWVTGWFRIFRADAQDWEWREENADLKLEKSFSLKEGMILSKRALG